MDFKTEVKLLKAKKKISDTMDYYKRRKRERFTNKVKSGTEEDYVVNRIAICIIKKALERLLWGEKIHVVRGEDKYLEGSMYGYMMGKYEEDRYIGEYANELDPYDADTQRRLTEMLYDKLSTEEMLCVEWEVYDKLSSKYDWYEKTLYIKQRV